MPRESSENFLQTTRHRIASRVGWHCSFPGCDKPTVGAGTDPDDVINTGTACHITAASPGGPRYDAQISSEERSSTSNGIWMCRDHGKAIDDDPKRFPVQLLREWKRQAEEAATRRVLLPGAPLVLAAIPSGGPAERLRAAAITDLEVFQRTAKWPATSVSLTLKLDGFDEPVATTAIAAIGALDDLIVVAPPGTGKTTTLFQIATGLIQGGLGIPIVVPLGEWATDPNTLLDSILRRSAFNGIDAAEFHKVAGYPGVVLILDGWNELDDAARKRAREQVGRLRAEMPSLRLVVSTRKQKKALDVPFGGVRVEILPLSENQQMEIARAMRGAVGAEIVDRAWRTPDIRELVTIPLYLTALLALPDGQAFPTTKEELLRLFVTAHENDSRHADALQAVVKDFQADYLVGLASFATSIANTTIADDNARRSITATQLRLGDNGQLTITPDTGAVLDVLVSDHILMRAGDTPGVSFQHQQFQEWYASRDVEKRILADVHDGARRKKLKAEIFDVPSWEEAIIFAVERMARSDATTQAACGKAIVAAFDVDPMLAAEMIYRATDEVWAPIAQAIKKRVELWHAPGKQDRALRFMMNSGRPDFLETIWPFITDENDQVSLGALRNCRSFRISLLGGEAAKRIKGLPSKARSTLLREIAMQAGVDGLDLTTAIAKADPDPEVQAGVVESMSFRRADRHVIEVLANAPDTTFDLVAKRDLIDDVGNEAIMERIAASRNKVTEKGAYDYVRMRSLVYTSDTRDRSGDVAALIAEMHVDNGKRADGHLAYEARQRYPRAVAEGLIQRVREGKPLFYGADDLIALARLDLEDDNLLNLALSSSEKQDNRAEAAASALGPTAAGRLVDAVLELYPYRRDEAGKFDKDVCDRIDIVEQRIAHLPGPALVAAIRERSATTDYAAIAHMAELMARHPGDHPERGRPYDADSQATIQDMVEDWGNRLLAGNAERSQLADIADLAKRAPDVSLLPLLRRLLDENLRRYRIHREEAAANGWRDSRVTREAQAPRTHEYQRAFLEIMAPETSALMQEYLRDEHFGELAARVLLAHWLNANEPREENPAFTRVNYEIVGGNRAVRAADPTATCNEAEAIFAAVETMIGDDATKEQKDHALVLGTIGVRMQHGERDDTIQTLLSITPRRQRCRLLTGLILSGEDVDTQLIADGIAETFEDAKTHAWILTQGDGFELREWVDLLPFTNRLADVLSIVRSLPDEHRNPRFLEPMIRNLGRTPSAGAEDVLFGLAEADAQLYANFTWRDAVASLRTETSAMRMVDLTANGMIGGKSLDDFRWISQLGAAISEFPAVRKHAYKIIKSDGNDGRLNMLRQAVAEQLDIEGVLLLVEIENDENVRWLGSRYIQNVVTDKIPVENWDGAYNIVSKPAVELRRSLLAMTTDGGKTDAAARCLTAIDSARDEYGQPIEEPRHPDLSSGKMWPILLPDPE